jgi:endonuclease YncB( thermonuclease family)
MKFSSKVFMALLFVLLLFASQASAVLFQAQVVEVVNSYTIKVLTADGVKVVRLAEVACPSSKFGIHLCAGQAREFIQEVTSGKEVSVEFWATDAAGRNVCEVFLPDGSSLGKLLVEKGYALEDKQYSSSPDLSRLEGVAKKNKQGVWRHVAQAF